MRNLLCEAFLYGRYTSLTDKLIFEILESNSTVLAVKRFLEENPKVVRRLDDNITVQRLDSNRPRGYHGHDKQEIQAISLELVL